MLLKTAMRRRDKRKRTKRRADQEVINTVRVRVGLRDLDCRFPLDARRRWPCDGFAEWAHRTPFRRSRTMGLPPEERHTTQGSMMLCTAHHRLYDTFQVYDQPTDLDAGANGPLRWYTADGDYLGEG